MSNVFPLPVSFESTADFKLNPKSEAGNPAPIENLEVIVNSGDDVTTTISEDGKTVHVGTTVSQIVNVTIQADKIVGEGVELLSETFDIAFSSPLAANLGIEFGTTVKA